MTEIRNSKDIQKELNNLMSAKDINALKAATKKALNAELSNPIQVINLLNSTVMRDVDAVKTVRMALGITKWDLSVIPFVIDPATGRKISVKPGKLLKTQAEKLAARHITFISGRCYECTYFESFTMQKLLDAAMDTMKKANAVKAAALKSELKAAVKAEKKAEKDAKKAPKKAKTAAEKERELSVKLYKALLEKGAINQDAYDEAIIALGA